MQSVKNAVIYGVFVWLVPFIAAVPFYSPDGEPLINIFLFKSIMMIVGFLTGAFFLLRYFKNVTSGFVREGVRLGLLWLAINLVLDFAILLQLSDMTMGAYFAEIGLRYLSIPIFTIAVGLALERKT